MFVFVFPAFQVPCCKATLPSSSDVWGKGAMFYRSNKSITEQTLFSLSSIDEWTCQHLTLADVVPMIVAAIAYSQNSNTTDNSPWRLNNLWMHMYYYAGWRA